MFSYSNTENINWLLNTIFFLFFLLKQINIILFLLDASEYFFNRSIASSYGYAEMTTTPVQTAQTSITAVGSGIQQLKGLKI